jgi:hypothetical protein
MAFDTPTDHTAAPYYWRLFCSHSKFIVISPDTPTLQLELQGYLALVL